MPFVSQLGIIHSSSSQGIRLLLRSHRELMPIFLMNLLTISLLFVNSSYSTDRDNGHSSMSFWRPLSHDEDSSQDSTTTSRHMDNNNKEDIVFSQDVSGSESSPQFFKTSIPGVGVKVNSMNNNGNSNNNFLSRTLKASESGQVHTNFGASQTFVPMDTFPGLDLEIDAIGLGGIPPGVRIENRNGRPVVEIVPNLGGLSSALDLSFQNPSNIRQHLQNNNNKHHTHNYQTDISDANPSNTLITSTHRPTSTSKIPTTVLTRDPRQETTIDHSIVKTTTEARGDKRKSNVSVRSEYRSQYEYLLILIMCRKTLDVLFIPNLSQRKSVS